MSDVELGSALRALGSRLDDEPVDLVPAVLARLDDAPLAPPRRPTQRLALVLALVALALAATAVAASQTVRGWLDLRGVDLEQAATLPTTSPLRLDDVGRRVDAAPAEAALDRALPESELLGPPDEIRLTADGRDVTLVWLARDGLPAGRAVPGVGALLTLHPASGEWEAIGIGKTVSATGQVSFVRITHDGDAVWIAGAPHAVTVFDSQTIRFRLAANVLIWSRDGVTYRLELTLPQARAIAIARALTPAS